VGGERESEGRSGWGMGGVEEEEAEDGIWPASKS